MWVCCRVCCRPRPQAHWSTEGLWSCGGPGADSNNLDFTVECWFLNRKYREDRQNCLHTWTFHSYPGGGRSKLFLKTQLNILTWTFFLTLHMHIDLCSIYFSVWWSLIRFSWQHVYCTFYFNWKRPTFKTWIKIQNLRHKKCKVEVEKQCKVTLRKVCYDNNT